MQFDAVLTQLDNLLLAKTAKKLSQREIEILEGDWNNLTYQEIANKKGLTVNYIKAHLAPLLWERLSNALEEEVHKRNWKQIINEKLLQEAQNTQQSKLAIQNSASNKPSKIGKPSEISTPYPINEQFQEVKKSIVQDGYQIVALFGSTGIGKTTMAATLCKEIEREREKHFQKFLWVSFPYPFPLNELLVDLLKEFQAVDLSQYQSINEQISLLIRFLNELPTLLVLEQIDNILFLDKINSNLEKKEEEYQSNYQMYQMFFRRLAQEYHQSCLLITSREIFPEFELLVASDFSVKYYEIQGLSKENLKEMMNRQSIQYKPEEIDKLLKAYNSNPLALKIVLAFIKEFCYGNVSNFYEFKSLIFGGIESLIAEDYQRLSDNEKKIVSFLAKQKDLISHEDLFKKDLLSNHDLMNSLISLKRRYILETSKDGKTKSTKYKLREIFKEYVENIENKNN